MEVYVLLHLFAYQAQYIQMSLSFSKVSSVCDSSYLVLFARRLKHSIRGIVLGKIIQLKKKKPKAGIILCMLPEWDFSLLLAAFLVTGTM